MKTELDRLRQRQRRYEWGLARGEQALATAGLVARANHDLLNFVQIVQLTSGELARRCDATSRELLDDLDETATKAQTALSGLIALAHPALGSVRGAPVAAAITAAIEAVRTVVAVELQLTVAPDTATRCTAEDLEHLVIGLALDVVGDVPRIELTVRERMIEGKPWVELVRGPLPPSVDGLELRVVEAIATRAKGELATSGLAGGIEVVVALPVV